MERTCDGTSFATRHVTAIQADEAIFTMTTSFHVSEEGFDWQEQAPPAHEPAGASLDLIRYGPFLVERMSQSSEVGVFHPCWVRLEEPIDPDPVMHACALTYISDYVGLGRRAVSDFAMLASLDHTVWFHRPVDINQWTLFCVEPMTSFGARGLARGTFHSRDGQADRVSRPRDAPTASGCFVSLDPPRVLFRQPISNQRRHRCSSCSRSWSVS